MLNTLTAFLLLFSSVKGEGKTTSSFSSEKKKTLGSLFMSHSTTVCLSEVSNSVRMDRTHMYEGRISQQKINNNSALILCDETYFFSVSKLTRPQKIFCDCSEKCQNSPLGVVF